MSYTPGPWRLCERNPKFIDLGNLTYTVDARHSTYSIAVVNKLEDAQLIVSAPDLLHACRSARECVVEIVNIIKADYELKVDPNHYVLVLDAAINKATRSIK